MAMHDDEEMLKNYQAKRRALQLRVDGFTGGGQPLGFTKDIVLSDYTQEEVAQDMSSMAALDEVIADIKKRLDR